MSVGGVVDAPWGDPHPVFNVYSHLFRHASFELSLE